MIDGIKQFYSAVNFYLFLTTFLIVLSWEQEHRSCFWLRSIGAGLIGLCAVWAYSVLAPASAVFYIVKYFLCFALACGVALFSYHMTSGELAYFGTCTYAMQHLCYATLMIFVSLLELMGVEITIGSGLFVFLEIVFNIGIFILVYILFASRLRNLTVGMKDRTIIIPLIILLVTAVVLDVAGFEADNAMRIVTMSYAALVCLTLLYAMYKVYEISMLVHEKKTVQELARKEKEQYELQKKNIEYINVKCHDLRKQLSYLIGGEVSEEKIQEIKRQTRIYDAIAKTGNETLDVILTERSLYCERENIRFTYMADGQLLSFLDAVDICAIFANLIDNAIEAVMKLPEQDRIISLKIDSLGNFVHIVIYNLFLPTGQIDGKDLRTTKNDTINHGFGLKSVSIAVDNHKGEMKVFAEDNVFNVNILIPLP